MTNIKIAVLEKLKLSQLAVALPLVGFFLPFLVPAPQLLTGALVNCFLFIFAFKLPRKNILAVSVLPSLGALANGLVFGPFTPFLLYFLPFIWLGNALLILSVAAFKNITPTPLAIGLSSLLKAAVLFVPALFYVNFNIVPQIFLTAMGIVQLATALLGGAMTVTLFKLAKIKYE